MIYFSDSEIDGFIAEDVPYFDLTAEILGVEGKASISFVSREDGVVSGIEEVARICQKLGLACEVHAKSGKQVAKGELLISAQGEAKAVLKAWKPSQNILEYTSAVATQTAKMVEAIRAVSPHTHFATTRKTIPATKKLALKAVLSGGGYAHRLGLSETVLIFDQYVGLTCMSMDECIAKAKAVTKEHKIAAEVKKYEDAVSAINAGADIVQCDKLSADETSKIKALSNSVVVIATGGITLQNVADYASAKPDVIVSSSVYYAKPFDIKVEIKPK
jgi:molybdenum transport protein